MSKIVLLVVGAAWAAVLIPPLVRGRSENRPHSSVVDFRRQLSNLQRSTPQRQVSPLRVARPLAPSPARPMASRRPAPTSRSAYHGGDDTMSMRVGSRAHLVRQRRQNVVLTLTLLTLGSAFIAFTTKSDFFIYVFVLSAMALVGYCYKLSQIRRFRSVSASYRRDWIRAA